MYAIIMQLTALLSPVKSSQTLRISARSRSTMGDCSLIAACSAEARGVCVSASASADLRVSAAARRRAAAYGVASRCFWKARTHGCLLSESGGE